MTLPMRVAGPRAEGSSALWVLAVTAARVSDRRIPLSSKELEALAYYQSSVQG